MIYREATINDWDVLVSFYKKIYRKNHPLHSKEFWSWQYGDKKTGRSFIMIDETINSIVGHLGANFKDDIAWMINGYLDQNYRGKNLMKNLYDLAREYYPLAATAANSLGLNMYRNMGWYRYYDLQRYVKLNPKYKNEAPIDLCREITVDISHLETKNSHYFEQPFLNGIKLFEGSTAVSQANVGGARLVDINDCKKSEEELWSLGYLWIDYITSWNDMTIKELIKNNWEIDSKVGIPWRLNPIEKGYYCDITFLSEKNMNSKLVVNRSYSDHGRIGSI